MSNSIPLRVEKSAAPAGSAAKDNLAQAIQSALFLQNDLTCLRAQNGLIAVLAQHELEVLDPLVKRLHVLANLVENCGCLTTHH